MSAPCPKCGLHLESPWDFCPHCGAAAERSRPIPREHEKAPVKGAFSGIVLGIVVAPVLIIVGVMLCLTGLGAFAGIPMIVAGVLAPLAGPLFGSTTVVGKCPWCDAPVSCLSHNRDFICPACAGRIAVKKHELMRAS